MVSMGQVGVAFVAALLAGAAYLWLGHRYDFFRGLMFAKWFRLFLAVFVVVIVAEWWLNSATDWAR